MRYSRAGRRSRFARSANLPTVDRITSSTRADRRNDRSSGRLQRMRRATLPIPLTGATTWRAGRSAAALVWLAALLLSGVELAAGDWPQWRGPSSRGVSQESGLPTTWSASENLAWRTPLAGLGNSSPIVWGDRVIVTSQIGSTPNTGGGHPQLARDERALAERETPIGGRRPATDRAGSDRDAAIWLVVEAFRRSDGQRLWEHKTRATGPFSDLHEKHNLATPTPATDGQRVYAWFGNGQVVALDMSGRMVWTRHLGKEYSPFQTQWGHGSSPTLHGDLVVLLVRSSRRLVPVGARRAYGEGAVEGRPRPRPRLSQHTARRAVRRKATSSWSTRRSASTPTIRKTGKLLWYTGSERQTPIPSAVFHDGRIFLSRGYRNSDYLAIRPGGRGDVTATHVEWRAASGASYVPSIVYYDGLLYMTNEVGVVTCADARTGEARVAPSARRLFFASPVAGDGKVYLVSETGETLRAAGRPQPRGAVAQRARRALSRLAGDCARAAVPAERRRAFRGGTLRSGRVTGRSLGFVHVRSRRSFLYNRPSLHCR